MTGKGIAEFEAGPGRSKVEALQRELAVEREKVAALADVQNQTQVRVSDTPHLLFGITGDRHTGSLYHMTGALRSFYDHCERRGVTEVYDAGDILDGHGVYKGQEFEVRDLGFDAQLERLAADAPANIETHFITGNHDASFKNAAGVSVGKAIERELANYHFLGQDQARVRWETPEGPYELMLLHPGGGSSYALSYRPQKIVESLEGGSKPSMIAIGHYHKALFVPAYRNVAIIEAGTFQRQTPFMARGGLSAHMGGWIVEVTVGADYNVVRAEFVAYY